LKWPGKVTNLHDFVMLRQSLSKVVTMYGMDLR